MTLSFLIWVALWLQSSAPQYSAATVVQSATNLPLLAPNAFGTIYGKNLAYSTRAMAVTDMADGLLPVLLVGTGVRVTVEGIAAPIWYVSPNQINFLVPAEVPQKPLLRLYVSLDGVAGPEVETPLAPVAPGLFAYDPETVLAVQLDGSPVKNESPAKGGQDLVLFATGLGPTIPSAPYRAVPAKAAPIARRTEFRLLLNDSPVDDSRIRYVGAAPGYAGLYQINLWVPEDAPPNSEIRIAVGDAVSPTGLRLALR